MAVWATMGMGGFPSRGTTVMPDCPSLAKSFVPNAKMGFPADTAIRVPLGDQAGECAWETVVSRVGVPPPASCR